MYFNKLCGIGREKYHQIISFFTNRIHSNFCYCYFKALSIGHFILFFPTIFTGCSAGVLPSEKSEDGRYCIQRINILNRPSTYSDGNTLDILIFDDDRLKRLDSYMRTGYSGENTVLASSTGGEKIIFLYYGSCDDIYSWAEINSYSSLGKVYCDLENERRESPVMTGKARCPAGQKIVDINMTPLSCCIRLLTLKCDFSGTLYENETVSDVSIYLINVNASCSIVPESYGSCARIINTGMLNPDDLEGFSDKSLIMHSLDNDIGSRAIVVDSEFFCYPNAEDRGMQTKLVVEGKIEGEVYYWPITVGENHSIERNICYAYNVTIRRKGTSHPDSEIVPEDIGIDLKIVPWKEKEEYPVMF